MANMVSEQRSLSFEDSSLAHWPNYGCESAVSLATLTNKIVTRESHDILHLGVEGAANALPSGIMHKQQCLPQMLPVVGHGATISCGKCMRPCI